MKLATMTKLMLCSALLWLAGSAQAQVQRIYPHPVPSHDRDLEIDVWMDQPDGAVYYTGEDIEIFFRANNDCYVTLYNIDTEGYISRIWPRDRYEDNFVRGHRTYRIPDRQDYYELRIGGPEGIEYIQAAASLSPYDVPNFERREPTRYHRNNDWDVSFGLVWGDPFIAINKINRHCIPDLHWEREQTAVDMAYFYVERYVFYPRTVCMDCHWNDRVTRGGAFDPYSDYCPEVVFYYEDDHNGWYDSAPRQKRYHPRYHYKKRADNDRYRYKDSGGHSWKDKGGPKDGRYKISGSMNVESAPREEPPAKYIGSKKDRNAYKDPRAEQKYKSGQEKMKPLDTVEGDRFKSLPPAPKPRYEDPRPRPADDGGLRQAPDDKSLPDSKPQYEPARPAKSDSSDKPAKPKSYSVKLKKTSANDSKTEADKKSDDDKSEPVDKRKDDQPKDKGDSDKKDSKDDNSASRSQKPVRYGESKD